MSSCYSPNKVATPVGFEPTSSVLEAPASPDHALGSIQQDSFLLQIISLFDNLCQKAEVGSIGFEPIIAQAIIAEPILKSTGWLSGH